MARSKIFQNDSTSTRREIIHTNECISGEAHSLKSRDAEIDFHRSEE